MKIYSLIWVSYDYHRFEEFVMSSLSLDKLIEHVNAEDKKYDVFIDPECELLEDWEQREFQHWEVITTDD